MYHAPISTNSSTAGTGSAIWAFRVPHAATKNIHVRSIDITLGGSAAAGTYGVEVIRGSFTSAPTGGTGITPSKGWSNHPASILTSSDIMFSAVALGGLAGSYDSSSIGNLLMNTLATAANATRLVLRFDKVGDRSLVFRPSGNSAIGSDGLAIRVIAIALVSGISVSGSVGWDEDQI